MEEQVLKELIKSRNILRKKFQSIKHGEAETIYRLENTFRPLTKPLKALLNQNMTNENIVRPSSVKSESSKFEFSTPKKNLKKEEYYEFPPSQRKQINGEENISNEDDDLEEDFGDDEVTQTDGVSDLSILKRDKDKKSNWILIAKQNYCGIPPYLYYMDTSKTNIFRALQFQQNLKY